MTQACATEFLGIDWEAVTRLPKWSLLILIGLTTLIQEDLACIGAGLLVVAGILTMTEALVTCFLGLWIGTWVRGKIEPERFRKVLLVVFFLIGLNLIRRAIF